jgi:hypothetical protein
LAVWAQGLDCQNCSEIEKDARGCEKDTAPYIVGGEKVTRCPARLISAKTKEYFKMYSMIRNFGCLMNDGGLVDQSARFLDVISIIDREIAIWRADKARK